MMRPWRASRIAVLISMLVASLATPLAPAFAGTPADDLKQIEYTYYFRGKYQQAIEALRTYLARVDLREADERRAHEVLAASYVLGGAPAMGKDVFLQMIARYPAYAGPDPAVFKLEVMNAYGEARSEHAALALRTAPAGDVALPAADEPAALSTVPSQGKPFYKKWWVYAGAAAALLIAGAASGGDDDAPPAASSGTVVVGVRVQ